MLNINVAGENILFGAFYRKGASSNANNKLLRELIDEAGKKYEKVLLCGDFNFPLIDWKNKEVKDTPFSPAARFYDCLLDNYMAQHVTEPTRKRGNDEESLLDLIITEDSQTQVSESIKIEPGLGKSDHYILKWNYLVAVDDVEDNKMNTEPPKLNYFKGNYEMFRDLCKNTD